MYRCACNQFDMISYAFTILGKPQGQARPRFARIGNFVRTYDPKQSRDWKNVVATMARKAGVRSLDGAVEVVVRAYMPRPKCLCRKCDYTGSLPALCKPDCDNIAKGVLDSMNGIAYKDDSAVVRCVVEKFYHAIGDVPRTEVTVRQILSAQLIDDVPLKLSCPKHDNGKSEERLERDQPLGTGVKSNSPKALSNQAVADPA